MKKPNQDALEVMRTQVNALIEQNYKTVEDFCWQTDLSKATVSNFLNSKKDFQVSTLEKISTALKKKLTIKLE